jgi:hypothetical protein
MKKLWIILAISIIPAFANALEVELLLENKDIPVNGAACGIIVFHNEASSPISCQYPSIIRETLWFELKIDGKVQVVRCGANVRFSGSGIVEMGSGTTYNFPFYLMKARGEHIFNEKGNVLFRAVVKTRVANSNQTATIKSDWNQLFVHNHP